jgi:regulator of sirC expression with transglutaminase-like and TPR domain
VSDAARQQLSDPQAILYRCGRQADAEIDLATAALALAALARPSALLAPYWEHLRTLAAEVAAAARSAEHDLHGRIRAINAVLFDGHGYAGDRDTYNDLRNADLMSVIDRRRGLPIALGILYIDAARTQGWPIEGVNFPGHFLLRLREGTAAVIVDPFNGGRICQTADLRELIKATQGEAAELQPDHCATAGNRQMLLRLQNNIKLRLLRDDRLAEAAEIVERMLMVAPEEATLWHEAGALHGRLGNLRAAISAFQNLVALSRGSPHHDDAVHLLADMKARLN